MHKEGRKVHVPANPISMCVSRKSLAIKMKLKTCTEGILQDLSQRLVLCIIPLIERSIIQILKFPNVLVSMCLAMQIFPFYFPGSNCNPNHALT